MSWSYLKEEKRCLNCAEEIYKLYLGDSGYDSIREIYKKLNDFEKNKFLKTSFFYYYRGWKITKDNEWYIKFDVGFIFISLISVLETIMSSEEHLDFGQWLNKHEKSGEVRVLWDEYVKEFGINKKVKEFFNNFVKDEDKQIFLSSILFSENSGNNFSLHEKIENIASLFYSLRSKFVHDSEYVPFSEDSDSSMFSFKGKAHYFNEINFQKIREILERSFLNYFVIKTNS